MEETLLFRSSYLKDRELLDLMNTGFITLLASIGFPSVIPIGQVPNPTNQESAHL